MDVTRTRRGFLTLAGAAVAGTALSGGAGAQSNEWRSVDSGIGKTLNDTVMSADGPYAVGAGGYVLARRADGWEPVLENGPTTESNGLTAAGVTDDGRNVWFCGGSGVVGQYDVEEEQLTDYSAPKGMTSTWEAIAVTGAAGAETVHLANGSGEVLMGTKTNAGGMDWGNAQKPPAGGGGDGSSITGIDFSDSEIGAVCNTSTAVYETTNGGGGYGKIGIPAPNPQNNLRDIAVVSAEDISVAASDGLIYRYSGSQWTPVTANSQGNTIKTVDRDGARGLAAGTSGTVYDRDGGSWAKHSTPTSATLKGAVLATSNAYPDVAVGGSGAVVERGEYTADAEPGPSKAKPWTEAESPTQKTLYSTAQTSEGPYAVGSGGRVLARRYDGWTVVDSDGPNAQGNPLRGADATDDGEHVWYAGGSGAVGQYDVSSGTETNYSAPKGKTSTWADVAVVGNAGSESIFLVNGSGEVLLGTNNGGDVTWGPVVKPGGGSSAKGIDFLDKNVGYICDTNAKVYETTNGGDSWHTVGIEGGSVGLYDVTAVSRDEINATGGDGSIFRYNGAVWTKIAAGGNALYGIDRDGDRGLATGSGGAMYRHTDRGWMASQTPTSSTLRDVALASGEGYPDVAVGSSGTIIERGEYTLDPVLGDARPTDPDGDGMYEDVNGNGKFNVVDVQALFNNREDVRGREDAGAFDFNGNGKFNVVDVQALFSQR